MQLVLLTDCPPQPWRNGGGTTRELLRWPHAAATGSANAGADDWLVRVSVAEIARDGPFSAYPHVDRWFAVLEGAGVRLALPRGEKPGDDGERVLRPGDEVLAFRGEDAPGCALIDGATIDLNLMVARAAGTGPHPSPLPPAGEGARPAAAASSSHPGLRSRMHLARPGSALRGRQPWRALYTHGAAVLASGDETVELAAGTLAWSDDHRIATWELAEAAGLAFWIAYEP